MQIIALLFFLVIFIIQLFRREWLAIKIKYFLGLSIIAVTAWSVFMSRAQYYLWQGSEMTKLFLPPHTSISYFIEYSFWNFWAPNLISFTIGLIFFWLAKYYNKRHEGQFFDSDELYIIWLSMFLVGHPLWIFYLLIFPVVIALVSIARIVIWKDNSKLPLYYFWLPIATFVILISKWLVVTSLFLKAKV